MAAALVVAAGRGERLGSDGPKAFAMLAGRPMVAWCLDAFRAAPGIGTIVVSVPPGWKPATALERDALDGCTVCEGGAERSFSVRNALAASSGPAGEAVLVHDAARPLLTGDLIARMIESIEGADGAHAAVAAAAVTDTIRVADVDGSVLSTPDRSTLRAMQTPQAFRRDVLERALAQDDDLVASATDDAALAEALGIGVKLIDSSPENLKVTTPTDIALAELLLNSTGSR